MSTNVYIHPILPIVIRSYTPDYIFDEGNQATTLEDIALLNAQPNKVYYVVDIPDLTVNVDNMLIWANMMARSDASQQKYKHPNVIENLMVVTQRMLELAAQNLNRPTMGAVKFKTFHTLEQALNYVEQQLGAER